MKKTTKSLKKRTYIKTIMYLSICSLLICVFISDLKAGTKGKALGHYKINGNPHNNDVLSTISINENNTFIKNNGIKTNGASPGISNKNISINQGGQNNYPGKR